ncbi:MAG TPA: hypothetical protein PKW82_10710 [Spirochaetales bacterium]|nr:hypothetical protein [Spirochaetales bacterium]
MDRRPPRAPRDASSLVAPAAKLHLALPVSADGTAAGTLTLYRGMPMTVVVSE